MIEPVQKKAGIRDFSFTYWIVIIFEFFERGSYYGVMSILSVYMTEELGFEKENVGLIKSTIQPLLYFLPILTGAIADKMGYRKTLLVAFGLLGTGYFLTSQATDYIPVFMFLLIMAVGAGAFKPVISGTIAKETNEDNSTLGFGIFYWSINLGAFLFPLILVPILKDINQSYVLIMAAIGTGAMIIPTLFLYKEPAREKEEKKPFGQTLAEIFKKIGMVFADWRFILFIFIYSWFWILYFQMFDSVLWYVKAFVDASELNAFVNNFLGMIGIANAGFQFDVEHVTVINAGTIILLQLLVSSIVKKTKALPTMLTGISLGVIGMAMLSISTGIWVFMAGIIIFSLGEMIAHPKFISYMGLIAPPDKKATYMGFGFLYGFFGSLIGGYLGAYLYVSFIDNPMIAFIREKITETGANITMAADVKISEALDIGKSIGLDKAVISEQAYTSELWLVFSGIGVVCIIGLLLYQKLIGTRESHG
jgi:POT family proton-dependent oligopeptide transporter